MKPQHLLPLLLLLNSDATLFAEEAQPPLNPPGLRVREPEVPPPVEPAKASADEAWGKLQELQKPPTDKPASREEAMTKAQAWLEAQQKGGEAFAKDFPTDARRWQAKLMALRTGAQMRRMSGQQTEMEGERKNLDEIINAADAPKTVKAEAAFLRAMTLSAEFKSKPASYIAFHEAAADFAKNYADNPLAEQMKQLDFRVLADDPTPQGAELLQKYAAGTDAKMAEAAKGMIAKRTVMAELRTKPVELQFTTVDSKDVDLALMRGKVVLVDFWASWCGPCIAEMPNVVSTYGKLHPKGFEILGISLDQDKDKMQEAMKKHGMVWAQYFDGEGWKNKISSKYGIDSIPATWLIDKKGMLRASGLRGEALAQAVAKLLAE